VALARAFVHRPRILFADEPTGNLDEGTGARVEDLLFDLNRERGTALVVVTHDLALADRCARAIRLRAGRMEESGKRRGEETARHPSGLPESLPS
jgi:putative ABC transport system ATP-binding protein